jgi:hypothetical protein
MIPEREKKNLIGFMLEAEHNRELTLGFLSKDNADELFAFFREQGFLEISLQECQDILDFVEKAHGLSIDLRDLAGGAAVRNY